MCVSRRAYGSKIRSRHSSGMPGPSSETPSWTTPSWSVPVDPDGRLGRRVLDRVLDEVLEDLAESRRVGQGVEARTLGPISTRWRSRIGRSEATTSSTSALEVDRRDRRRPLGHDPDRGQDRVDEPVQPLDLLERGPVPGGPRLAPGEVARFAAAQRRLVGEQVGVGADDRERRPQLVGDQRDQLAARLVDRLERLDPRLGLGLLAALLDDPGQQVGDRPELGDVVVAEVRGCSVWTLRTPTIWSCQVSGTDSIDATKRRWSMPRTHRKRGSARTSGMTSGSRLAATRPVTPSPNGTRARPIWKRSRPFVAASVRYAPSRSSR